MTRRKWTGVAGVLFGVLMLVGILISGETPDRDASNAVEQYAQHWADGSNQDDASRGAMLLMYATALLVCFSAGLRHLLRRGGNDGPLPSLALAAGTASAAAFAVGAMLINGAGIAAAEGGYTPTGDAAMLVESIGYYAVSAAVMLAAVSVVAVGIANRQARVLPQWTIALTVLVAIAGAGNIYTAWLGFMLVPLWSVVVGIVLLVVRADDVDDVPAAVI